MVLSIAQGSALQKQFPERSAVLLDPAATRSMFHVLLLQIVLPVKSSLPLKNVPIRTPMPFPTTWLSVKVLFIAFQPPSTAIVFPVKVLSWARPYGVSARSLPVNVHPTTQAPSFTAWTLLSKVHSST